MKFSEIEYALRIPVVIWKWRNVNLVNFGLFASAGATLGYSICFFYLNTRGIPVGRFCWEMALVLNLCTLLFAKIFGCFSVGIPIYFRNFWHFFNQTTFYQQGGMIGLILGTIVLSLFLEIPLTLMGDGMCLGGIAIMTVGRMGCHHYGCCTGIPTSSRFAIKYIDPDAKICRDHPALQNTPLIPVQMVSAAVDLLIFATCCMVAIYAPVSGLLTVIVIVGVNLKRFLIQHFRLKATENKIPYRRVALYISLSWVLIMSLIYFTGESFFQFEKPLHPFTISGYFRFLVSDPDIPASLILVSLINFAVYGIHGRRIGTHTNFSI